MINSSAVESCYLSGGQCHRPLCTYPPGDGAVAFRAAYAVRKAYTNGNSVPIPKTAIPIKNL